MAERRAMNKYYPPDWDPSKGSINKYVGQHPLRDRARKLDQGILIVRFEMPYNSWCLGCDCHIGKGVRFNAEKKQVGNYHSSKILNFRMKCHQCSNHFEIQTDPQNSAFKIVSGLKQREETWEPDYEAGEAPIKGDDSEEQVLLQENPMYRLQHVVSDREKGKQLEPTMTRLYEVMDKRSKDDYQLSSLMRKNFREQKKQDLQQKLDNESRGIFIPLLPLDREDIELSNNTNFKNSLKRKSDQDQREKFELIKTASIIPSNTTSSTISTTTTSSTTLTKFSFDDKEKKRKEILKKKARIDPSLFSATSPSTKNITTKPNINTVFSSSLYKKSIPP
eukprot:gene5764-7173_t